MDILIISSAFMFIFDLFIYSMLFLSSSGSTPSDSIIIIVSFLIMTVSCILLSALIINPNKKTKGSQHPDNTESVIGLIIVIVIIYYAIFLFQLSNTYPFDSVGIGGEMVFYTLFPLLFHIPAFYFWGLRIRSKWDQKKEEKQKAVIKEHNDEIMAQIKYKSTILEKKDNQFKNLVSILVAKEKDANLSLHLIDLLKRCGQNVEIFKSDQRFIELKRLKNEIATQKADMKEIRKEIKELKTNLK